MALLEKAAGQGHAYAMDALGIFLGQRKEHEQALRWLTMGAEAGLPHSMFHLGVMLDSEEGVGVDEGVTPDYPAAAGWCRRAANAGNGNAAHNLFTLYSIGRGRA